MVMSRTSLPHLPTDSNLTIPVRFDKAPHFDVDLPVEWDYTQIVEVNVLMRTDTYKEKEI